MNDYTTLLQGLQTDFYVTLLSVLPRRNHSQMADLNIAVTVQSLHLTEPKKQCIATALLVYISKMGMEESQKAGKWVVWVPSAVPGGV